MKNIDGNSSESISNIHSPKYIYIGNCGGLWHFLNCIGSVIDIAKKSKREIIIDCKRHLGFNCNFSKIFDIINPILKCDEKLIDKCGNEFKSYLNINNLFYNSYTYSDPPSKSYIVKGIKLEPFTFKEYENKILTSLSNNKTIILFSGNRPGTIKNFIECVNRIKINKDTRKVVEDLYKSLPEKYIGIHYRNTDLKSNLDSVCKSLQSIINKNNCYNVFVATDTYYIINEFEVKFPECKFFYNKKLIKFDNLLNKSNSIGLHYVPQKYFKADNVEKYFLHQNYIADIYCVINSIDYITTNGNNVRVVPMFRKNKELKKKFFRDKN